MFKGCYESWFELPGSQILKSRPEPPFSFSFLELSWFEQRRISKGSGLEQ
jgi:hypothetical protein